jgi:hypothetical protein
MEDSNKQQFQSHRPRQRKRPQRKHQTPEKQLIACRKEEKEDQPS